VREIICARDYLCERLSAREVICARGYLCERLSVSFDRVGLPPDSLPIAVHLGKGPAACFGQPIVFPRRAIGGLGLRGLHKSLLFEPPEDVVNCSFAYEQALGFAKLSFYFVAIHSSVAYVVKDGQHEKPLAGLVCPVFEEDGVHRHYDKRILVPVNDTYRR